MSERKILELSDRDHVLNWIAILLVGEFSSYDPILSALQNISDFHEAMLPEDADRLGKALRAGVIQDDPELLRQIRGIRRYYPQNHWWWYPENL